MRRSHWFGKCLLVKSGDLRGFYNWVVFVVERGFRGGGPCFPYALLILGPQTVSIWSNSLSRSRSLARSFFCTELMNLLGFES